MEINLLPSEIHGNRKTAILTKKSEADKRLTHPHRLKVIKAVGQSRGQDKGKTLMLDGATGVMLCYLNLLIVVKKMIRYNPRYTNWLPYYPTSFVFVSATGNAAQAKLTPDELRAESFGR